MTKEKFTIDETIKIIKELKILTNRYGISTIRQVLDLLDDNYTGKPMQKQSSVQIPTEKVATKSDSKLPHEEMPIKMGRPRKIVSEDKKEFIINLHREGLSTRDISDSFLVEFGFKVHRDTINDFINRLKNDTPTNESAIFPKREVSHRDTELNQICPKCRSKNILKHGFYYFKNSKFRRYLCGSCNKQFSDNKNIFLKENVCPYCESRNTYKHGFRYRKNRGAVQKYRCNECNKKFSDATKFKRMFFSGETVEKAIKFHNEGKSLRDIKYELKKEGIITTHTTIMAWIDKFADAKRQSSTLHSDGKLDTTKNKRAKNRKWTEEEMSRIINEEAPDEDLAKEFGLSVWTIHNYKYLFKHNHPELDKSKNHFDKKWNKEYAEIQKKEKDMQSPKRKKAYVSEKRNKAISKKAQERTKLARKIMDEKGINYFDAIREATIILKEEGDKPPSKENIHNSLRQERIERYKREREEMLKEVVIEEKEKAPLKCVYCFKNDAMEDDDLCQICKEETETSRRHIQ